MENLSMQEMLDSLEGSLKSIHVGDLIKGKVISINENEVFVNISYITDGIIQKSELSDETEFKNSDIVKIDDEILVCVINVNDGDGNVELSLKRAEYYKVWEELKTSFENGTLINVKVKEAVKGGVISIIKGVRAFIPASQLSMNYVENLEEYVGKVLEVKVIEFDEENEKVVLSRKEVEKAVAEVNKDKVWETLVKGEKRKGVVKKLAKYGAFVDIGGVDGLVHISDMSWKRISDPSEVVAVGDNVEVFVLDFDKVKGRISLGLKEVEKDPWNYFALKSKIGDIFKGKVVNLQNFGAFVEIEDGIQGLVHVSNISEDNVINPASVLKIGQEVRVKLLEIDEENKKISLSIKDASTESQNDYSNFNNSESMFSIGDLFKDKFKDFR